MGVHNTTAVRKWKAANPANLGFDEYHATVAVAPTSTTNCGCDPAWAKEGKGCIAGGGAWVDHFIHNTSGPFFDRFDARPSLASGLHSSKSEER